MDRFDDIWKNSFNEPEKPDGDWSLPSDTVWEAISAGIEPERKRGGLLLWWIGIGFLVAALLGLTLLYSKKGTDHHSDLDRKSVDQISVRQDDGAAGTSNSQIEFDTDSNKDLQQEKPKLTEDSALTDKTLEGATSNENVSQDQASQRAEVGAIDSAEKTINRKATKAVVPGRDQGNEPENNRRSNEVSTAAETEAVLNDSYRSWMLPEETASNDMADSSARYSKFGGIDDSQAGLSIKTSQTISTLNHQNKQSLIVDNLEGVVSPIPVLANQEIHKNSLNQDLRSGKTSDQQSIPLPFSSGSWAIGLSAGPMFWNHVISDEYTTDLSPFDFNYEDGIGYAVQVEAAKKIGKGFGVQLGLDYERVNIVSGHNSTLDYSLTGEETSGQDNDYSVSLATPYGLMKTDFTFFRNQALDHDTVSLLVDFKNAHLVQNLRMPISFYYNRSLFGSRLAGSVGLGAGLNYLIGIENAPSSINTNHTAVHYQDGSAVMIDQDINRLHFDMFANVGLRYDLGAMIDLHLSYEFSKGLSPLFQLEKYQTKIDRHYLSLGLSKRF